MIVEFVAHLLVGGVTSLLTAVLPSGDPPWSSEDLTGWLHFYSWFNSFLPLDEMLGVVVLSVEVLTVMMGVWVVVWLLRRLPLGLGGS